jgi:hypothetical protein
MTAPLVLETQATCFGASIIKQCPAGMRPGIGAITAFLKSAQAISLAQGFCDIDRERRCVDFAG